MENRLPQRKHPRLEHYDYGTAGAYYITICTQNRRCLLSHIVGRGLASAEVQYTAYGQIAEYIVNNPKQWELDKLYLEE